MKIELYKKAVQLKLASMSENYTGKQPKKSGKHRSQEMQRARKLAKRK